MRQTLPLLYLLTLVIAACAPVTPAPAVMESPVATVQSQDDSSPLGTETVTPELDTISTATVSPVATDEAQYSSHPLSTRTGDLELDAILAALESGNIDDLHNLIEFSSLGCTRQDGLGGPPKCREVEAEGTPVEALPFLGSEGSFLRRDEFENWRGIDASGLYAVYQNSPDVYDDEFYPAGEQTVLLATSRGTEIIALRVRAGRIVRVDSLISFGMESLETTLEREAAQMILTPASR